MFQEITISGGFHLGLKKKKHKRKAKRRASSRRNWRKSCGRFKRGFMDEVHRIAPRAGATLCRYLYRALKWVVKGLLTWLVLWILLAVGMPPELLLKAS